MNEKETKQLIALVESNLRKINRNYFKEGELNTIDSIKSFDQHGMSWVESTLNTTLDDVTVLSPLHASSYSGGNATEFDEWRATVNPSGPTDFQGVLIDSSDLVAQCYRLNFRDGMSNIFGEEYSSDKIGLLVIDRSLIEFISKSFHFLIAEFWSAPQNSFCDLAKYVQIPRPEDVIPDSIDPALDSSELQIALDAKSQFKDLLTISAAAEWPPGGAREAARFLKDLGHDLLTQHQYHRYIWSMTLHFLTGHEYGHICFHRPENGGTSAARAWADAEHANWLTSNTNLNEELYCDFLGSSNALFQAQRFEVPSCIPFSVVGWCMCCIKAILDSKPNPSNEHREASRMIKMRHDAQIDRWKADDIFQQNVDSQLFYELSNVSMPELARSAVKALSL